MMIKAGRLGWGALREQTGGRAVFETAFRVGSPECCIGVETRIK